MGTSESKQIKKIERKRNSKNLDVYQKLRREIEDGSVIEQKFAEARTQNSNKIVYFAVSENDNAIHKHYHFLKKGDYQMRIQDIEKIFDSTEYGDKKLLDLLMERFDGIICTVNLGPLVQNPANAHPHYEVELISCK